MTSIYNNPALLENAAKWGEIFYQSGFFGCLSKEQGAVMALEMITTNSTPLAMAERYHIMGSKVTMAASAMLADFIKSGGIHRIQSYNSELVAIEFEKGETKLLVSMSWEEAQAERWPYGKNGKLSASWSTPLGRAAMLFARATTRGIRAVAPEINGGCYSPEELGSEDAPTVIQPADMESLLPEHLMKASVNSYCTQAHLDGIESIMQQVEEWDPEIREKIEARIGLRQLNELTMKEADELIEALRTKQAKHLI